MPASCRVRRQATFPSPYVPLLNDADRRATELGFENAARNERHTETTRPRSRTITGPFVEASPRPLSRETSLRGTRGQLGERRTISQTPSYSLVADHLSSRRHRPASHTSDFSDTQPPTEVVHHGSQIDIILQGENDPGLFENAVADPIHCPPDDEDHNDDVVEHLDVLDPYVATVSHLSNAANSIIIPPMSLYSRRPVIHLPNSQLSIPSDLEKSSRCREHMDNLDRHVEHVLSKRDKLRQTAAGIWSFLKTPMGFITALYGFCVVFWGAAIVLFLLNWIPTSSKDRRGFWIEVSSQVENALFTLTGIGLLPWRVIDTYRILQIWKLKRLSNRLRKQEGLPELYDEDDLPDPQYDPNFVRVLKDKQQRELYYQQKEFAKSQTWYRPHGTETHRAFPIGTALSICLFVDGNSFFQAMLCGCMWSMNRYERPPWTTGTLIPASFMCGIIAAILIWRGGQKTKRTKVVEERLRAALEAEQTGTPAPVDGIHHGNQSNVQLDASLQTIRTSGD